MKRVVELIVRLALNYDEPVLDLNYDFGMEFLFKGPSWTSDFNPSVLDLNLNPIRYGDRFPTYPRQRFPLFIIFQA